VKRRAFISLLGGMAACPLVARAQQRERVRRIGVFMPGVADDAEFQARNAAFLQGLGELGWTVGRNLRIDYCWGAGDPDRFRACAADIVGLAPEAILGASSPVLAALRKETRTIPIVFTGISDPVGVGFVASLADRAAISRGLRTLNRRWAESGCRNSNKWHQA